MNTIPFTTNDTALKIKAFLDSEIKKAADNNHWRFDYPVKHTVIENEDLSVSLQMESDSLIIFVHYSDTKPHHGEIDLRMHFVSDGEGRTDYKSKRTILPREIKVPNTFAKEDLDDNGEELLHHLAVASSYNKFLSDMIPVINEYATSVTKHVDNLVSHGHSKSVMAYKA